MNPITRYTPRRITASIMKTYRTVKFFRAVTNAGKTNFSMLGLGDVVIPGLLLSFVLRFEKHKNKVFDEALSRPKLIHRLRYFYCTLVGYFLGE